MIQTTHTPWLMVIMLLSAITINQSCLAASNPISKSIKENLRWSLDLASRAIHKNINNETANIQMVGLDLHSVVSSKKGDLGTIILQSYLIRIDNFKPYPAYFSDDHDWAITYRNFNFNYKNTCRNCPNIRIGHFELPFGLEYTIDTAGEVRDYNHRNNIGHKTDWGIALNKQHRQFEYELSYSLGSGNHLRQKQGERIISGRIGSLPNQNWVIGLSYANANLANIHKQKTAIDIKHFRGAWGYFFEYSAGSERLENSTNTDVKDILFEINWRDSAQDWLVFTQLNQKRLTNKQNKELATLGMRYDQDRHWSVEAKLNYPLHSSQCQNTPWELIGQIRYRY